MTRLTMKITFDEHMLASTRAQELLNVDYPIAILSRLQATYTVSYGGTVFAAFEVDEKAARIIKSLASPYYRTLWKMYLVNDEIPRYLLDLARK